MREEIKMGEEDTLNEILERWKVAAPERPRDSRRLAQSVWARIEHHERSERMNERIRFAEWWRDLVERPRYAIAAAAALVLGGFLAGSIAPDLLSRAETGSVDRVYRLSIDPLMRLESEKEMDAISATLRAPATLSWLKDELDLDAGQFERVVLLHSLYQSEFEKLFAELVNARSKFEQMEQERFEDDVIDFFAVYDLVKRQEALREASNRLTNELLVKLAEVMAPEQWERYQSLVRPGTSDLPAASPRTTDV